MSKKTLDVQGISNELAGASLFFTTSHDTPESPASPTAQPSFSEEPAQPSDQSLPTPDRSIPSPVGLNEMPLTNPYNMHASTNASKLASTQDSKRNDLVKTIRKSVRQVGKEVLFVRLSPDEKNTVGSIVYAFYEMYRGDGFKTSENEIGRIAVNYLLENYQDNQNNSILAQVLAALKA